MIRLAPGDPTDRGSEYGRLLAQRDRLVSQGVDPAELLVPHPPGAKVDTDATPTRYARPDGSDADQRPEGFEWVGIEREAEYVAIAEARLKGTQRGLGLGA